MPCDQAYWSTWTHFIAIELPELPKPKLHNCSVDDLTCYQEKDGTLYMQWGDKTVYAEACPFCGYSPEK